MLFRSGDAGCGTHHSTHPSTDAATHLALRLRSADASAAQAIAAAAHSSTARPPVRACHAARQTQSGAGPHRTLNAAPTSPPPTGLFRRRRLPVPEYRPHPSNTPGCDTRQLSARLFSSLANPPSAVLAPGPSECICSSRAITGSPWPGLVQQSDQIAASAIYPYSLGLSAI